MSERVKLSGQERLTCRSCSVSKPIDEFPWINQARGYKRGVCKPCYAARAKASRAKKAEYYKVKAREYHHANKDKRNAQRRARNAKNPDLARNAVLKAKYGITVEDYERMLEAQGGVCKVCEKPETARNQHGIKRLAVDHCHKTGRVRGLLCAACNVTLGHLREDEAYAARLLAYLQPELPQSSSNRGASASRAA